MLAQLQCTGSGWVSDARRRSHWAAAGGDKVDVTASAPSSDTTRNVFDTDLDCRFICIRRAAAAGRRPADAARSEIAGRGLTPLGVSLAGLGRPGDVQPELPLDDDEGERLDTVLDAVRERFGSASVSRATQLGRDPGWSTPVLPEHE